MEYTYKGLTKVQKRVFEEIVTILKEEVADRETHPENYKVRGNAPYLLQHRSDNIDVQYSLEWFENWRLDTEFNETSPQERLNLFRELYLETLKHRIY